MFALGLAAQLPVFGGYNVTMQEAIFRRPGPILGLLDFLLDKARAIAAPKPVRQGSGVLAIGRNA